MNAEKVWLVYRGDELLFIFASERDARRYAAGFEGRCTGPEVRVTFHFLIPSND